MQQVSAAVIISGNRYFIARRTPGGSLGNKWEFPGGKVEPGETPQECLAREMFEEFEVNIDVGAFIGSHRFFNGKKEYELMAYHADVTGGDFVLHDHVEMKWVTLDDMARYDFAESDRAIIAILQRKP